MPSIMDLVREYSELEIKRNERGGMLDPHSEIRYQALKFFLEFDLFPMPIQKPVETYKYYEKKKEPSSDEIKKPVEVKQTVEVAQKDIIEEKREEREGSESISTAAPEPVSDIHKTTLQVEDNTSTINPQVEPISQIEEAVVVENIPTIENTEVNTPEKGEDAITGEAEVLEMVDAIDGAVDSIIVADTPTLENLEQRGGSEQSPIHLSNPVEEVVSNTATNNFGEIKTEGVDLISQIDNAIENAIQPDEKIDNQVQIQESVMPYMPEIKPEQNNVVIPEIPPIEMTQLSDILTEVSHPIEESHQEKTIDIEELLNPAHLAMEPATETSNPVLNIEEIISSGEQVDGRTYGQSQTPPRSPQIDFLSGIGLSSESANPPIQTQVEEILPSDILSEVPPSTISSQMRVFVHSPSKAAVHLIDGDARRGIIKELNDSQMEVELFEDETMQNSIKIPTSEIKAIFIMRHSGESITIPDNGVKINVRFKDDRSISGISSDYSESAEVFTLLPVDSIQSARLILIYRGFVDSVEVI
ncbi:MAG: DUF6982 domain-containing protein [Myxococcota bacterium]